MHHLRPPIPINRAPSWGAETGCLRCHAGIESIREPGSEMMRKILAEGRKLGDPSGCVVCHGGNPKAPSKGEAHAGPNFFPDAGSPWINEKTCGRCHEEEVRAQWQSLMMTEAGKIQGVVWSTGGATGYEHKWGNYNVRNLPADKQLGSETYKRYRDWLAALEPQVFPQEMSELPPAPEDLAVLSEHPEQVAFTYLRTECQRCHLAVRGRQTRGDYRGMGCSACHIPYSNEGLYEGGDKSIPKDESGHLLVHRIQATGEAKVKVGDVTCSGIPLETCTTCHNLGKRIGVSYQGVMESAYDSPWGAGGEGQPGLHTKHYIGMRTDLHANEGMLCQDCHTSLDVHGDGTLSGANLAQVEIECQDCHGTPEGYPWELPIGYGDEFGKEPPPEPRGVATELPAWMGKGTVYPVEDGYLLSARGNPLGNVVRRGNLVVVHTAGGKDIKLKPLKKLLADGKLSTAARVAMVSVAPHISRMECYACHTNWVPQCYGCHVKVDFSQGKSRPDWVARGHARTRPGHLADAREDGRANMIPGSVKESRAYMRWEEPVLGVNGEGRISPIAPGCQAAYTIIGEDGKAVLADHIFRTLAGTEGGGESGQLAIDMSPTTPHTTSHARGCESCHTSAKAAGYGIGGGGLTRKLDRAIVVDLMTAGGKVIPRKARPQIERIDGPVGDWSAVVDKKGRQLQTVGHHFTGSRPLNDRERTILERAGVCLACHQEIPEESAAVNLLHHVAEASGLLPATAQKHGVLLHKILLSAAWAQTGAAILFGLALPLSIWRFRRRR